jgi:hypothetical protein
MLSRTGDAQCVRFTLDHEEVEDDDDVVARVSVDRQDPLRAAEDILRRVPAAVRAEDVDGAKLGEKRPHEDATGACLHPEARLVRRRCGSTRMTSCAHCQSGKRTSPASSTLSFMLLREIGIPRRRICFSTR